MFSDSIWGDYGGKRTKLGLFGIELDHTNGHQSVHAPLNISVAGSNLVSIVLANK